MERNIGNTDRIIRFAIATIIGIFYITRMMNGNLGIFLMLLALVFFSIAPSVFASFTRYLVSIPVK